MRISIILTVLFYFSVNTNAKAQKQYPQGYLEAQTGHREILIHLDSIIIDNVAYTLVNEGCSNLYYFLQNFQNSKSFREYPIGFNFAKFNSGFGDSLKKEICKSLASKEICIDEIIENIFAPGRCHGDSKPYCYPICSLIFVDKDPVVLPLIKERIATKGYRIKYNFNNKKEPILEENINREWIKLFSVKELELIDKEQVSYLRSFSTKKN
ncbi:MAG: hypothetical protein ACI828_002679 [Flavobacteriales bacterium]|jgi:hypothetical protein